MSLPTKALFEVLGGLLGRLRFPQLFLLSAVLLIADLFVPDVIPLVDEILLALLTLALGNLKRPKGPPPSGAADEGPVIDIRPE